MTPTSCAQAGPSCANRSSGGKHGHSDRHRARAGLLPGRGARQPSAASSLLGRRQGRTRWAARSGGSQSNAGGAPASGVPAEQWGRRGAGGAQVPASYRCLGSLPSLTAEPLIRRHRKKRIKAAQKSSATSSNKKRIVVII